MHLLLSMIARTPFPQGWQHVTSQVEARPRQQSLARRETTLCARIEILVPETADSATQAPSCLRIATSAFCLCNSDAK